MTNVFLVDDEPLAVRRLSRLLEAVSGVTIVGEATDARAAVDAILARPEIELVFLDISMPELDGFGVATRLPGHVMIVFTTAHDEHALRAFGVNAIDYLLKPVRAADLKRALDKHAALKRVAPAPERIASRIGDKIQLVDLDRVTHFYADDKLTYAQAEGRNYIVDASMNELEGRYRAQFVRIHRATLVRATAIAELLGTAEAARVRLVDGTELAVARERVRSVKDRLGL
jgi:DNA-binding LytR/AlgR family response regulator